MVHQLRSHHCLVQQNNYFRCHAVNSAQHEICLSCSHIILLTQTQFVSHDDLGPLLPSYCSSTYSLICICALQVSSTGITIHGTSGYWISSSWFKCWLQLTAWLWILIHPSKAHTTLLTQELLYVCSAPSSMPQMEGLTRTRTKAVLGCVLQNLPSLFDRERNENHSLSVIFCQLNIDTLRL